MGTAARLIVVVPVGLERPCLRFLLFFARWGTSVPPDHHIYIRMPCIALSPCVSMKTLQSFKNFAPSQVLRTLKNIKTIYLLSV